MWLIHRVLFIRLLVNFALLFSCLYLFATTIDLVLNLDEFTTIARRQLGEDSSWLARLWRTIVVAADYELPQVFQFYGFLHGLVAIAAVGFTCVQMARSREFVAIAAAGVSLRRLLWPVVALAGVLGGVQVLNQEVFMPKVSGLLLRAHGQAGDRAIAAFRVPFTDDGTGTLLQAAAFDPGSDTLQQPAFLHRDEAGRTLKRVWASQAQWDEIREGWVLTDGLSVSTDPAADALGIRDEATFEPSTLGPRRLIIQRRSDYAGMMSTPTLLGLVADATTEDDSSLRRALGSRIALPLVNLLCVLIAAPFFIDRLPGEMLLRTMLCCGLVLPLYMLGVGLQMVPLPPLGPLAGVLAPLVLLTPIACWRVGSLPT
ncbi:MAG: LptF/LptG family permease [Phycisphaerales bacterium]|nr:LptF/LptG family permease [Phycisphaerales bacterium]